MKPTTRKSASWKHVSHELQAMIGALITVALLHPGLHAQPVTKSSATATVPGAAAPFFENPVEASNIDASAVVQWVDGKKQPLPTSWSRGAASVLWMKDSVSDIFGQSFGDSKTPGPRSVTIGFKRPIKAGSFLVRGSVAVSVLKTGVTYPGNGNDSSQWVQAQRIEKGQLSANQGGDDDFTLWVLPPGVSTSTRAIRLTHTAKLTDSSYAGSIGGLYVLPDRYANLAALAQIQTGSNQERAGLLIDGSNNGFWNSWDNGSEGSNAPITKEHPESIVLLWPRPVTLCGLSALSPAFGSAYVQTYTGPTGSDPRLAPDSVWMTFKSFEGLSLGYPTFLYPNWMDFGRSITTRAIRFQITSPTVESHGHLTGNTKGGKRVWLPELMALQPLGEQPLAAVLPVSKTATPAATAKPPIPIRFNLPAAGNVTLVIEGMSGKRVRNLVSDTPFPAGPNVVWWDGTNDLGRDVEAAGHGLYHIPAQFVLPGTYRVRSLYHKPLDLRYEFSVYNAGQPAWETRDGTGGWLTNHTPPSSTLFVPPFSTNPTDPNSKPVVLLGSYISEGGAGLAWVDLNGRKLAGRGWVGGNWTGAHSLARDSGNNHDKETYAYVGAPLDGELRLTALTPSGDRAVLPESWKFPGTTDAEKKEQSVLGGIAAYNELLVASLPKQNQLLFVDTALHRPRTLTPLPDARGVAFDKEGHLLVLSKSQLLRYTLPTSLAPAIHLNSQGWIASASAHSEDAAKALGTDPNSRWSTVDLQSPGQTFTLDMKAPQTFSVVSLYSAADRDSPKSYELAVSDNGTEWRIVASGEGKPTQTVIEFPRTTARYIKLTQTGTTTDTWWSINRLDIFDAPPTVQTSTLPEPEVLVSDLEDPQGVTSDASGAIYISDRGHSHQVKVYDSTGKLLRAIGHAGVPQAGPYDALHMNNPKGVTIDSNGRLWVAEEDFQPKRVSVWDASNGQFWKAFYGPAQYGGGGSLDPRDKTRFYYTGMEFKLDWKTGANLPSYVIYRPQPGELTLPDGYGAGGQPETALYARGRQYMTNCYNSMPTSGSNIALLWVMKNHIAVPVAAMGRVSDWSLLQREEFKSRVGKAMEAGQGEAFFAWSDTNADGQIQPTEVTALPGKVRGVTVMPDLSFVVAVLGDKTMKFSPTSFSSQGVPNYNLVAGKVLVKGAQSGVSSGGEQALIGTNGWTIHTNAPLPYSPYGIGGALNGVPMWSYPSMWPGLHASHEAAIPTFRGELIGTTRLLGGMVTPKGEGGPLWSINGNMGNVYLFTQDGLFVSQLFQDVRQGPLWSMPVARRNTKVNEFSLHDENFWPTISQSAEGTIYLNSSLPNIVRVDGLETIKRLPATTIKVTTADLKQAQAYLLQAELDRQKAQGTGKIRVRLQSDAPQVDGKLDEWSQVDWATIDKSGVGANFNSNSRPYDYSGAVAVSGPRLYAAWKTADPNLLRNTGEVHIAPFKTGGALDLMIGANPKADPQRLQPIEGDSRLIVTLVKDKPLALLYRAVVPGTAKPVSFSSPWRTITIDRVEDVSSQLEFAKDDTGNYEISIPLALFGLHPQDNQTIKGDIGVLRGNGFQTQARVYWSNKATGITADVPSEAQLTPKLWGLWQFANAN